MPRSPRIHATGAMYHVTLRGNHRQDIFFAAADCRLLTTITTEVIESCSAQVHAYCYMPNHIHALIQVDDTPLSNIMLLIASQYARRIQARLETTGHFFERRYHAVLVDTDAYLKTLLRYIRHNPVRAHLTSVPDDYPWSSHHTYLGTRPETWITTDFALRMFDSDRERAISAYRAFMTCSPTRSPLAECNARDPRILGSDSFARRLLGDNWKPPFNATLQQTIDAGCARFGVTSAELRSASRLATVVQARQWITETAVAARIATVASLSRYFNRNISTFRHTTDRRRSRAQAPGS
jgi:putative transposase